MTRPRVTLGLRASAFRCARWDALPPLRQFNKFSPRKFNRDEFWQRNSWFAVRAVARTTRKTKSIEKGNDMKQTHRLRHLIPCAIAVAALAACQSDALALINPRF